MLPTFRLMANSASASGTDDVTLSTSLTFSTDAISGLAASMAYTCAFYPEESSSSAVCMSFGTSSASGSIAATAVAGLNHTYSTVGQKRGALVLYAASMCAAGATVTAGMVPAARAYVFIGVHAPDASPPPALALPPPLASAAPAAVSRTCPPACAEGPACARSMCGLQWASSHMCTQLEIAGSWPG